MDINKLLYKAKSRLHRAFDGKGKALLGKVNKKQKGSFGRASKHRSGQKELREKTFFGFGRGVIGYLILLALAVVFTQALHSSLSAVLMAFLIIWPILNFIYLIIIFSSLDAYVEHSELNVIKNQPTTFKIQIVNNCPFPVPFAEADFRLPEKNALRCSAKRVRIAAPPNSDYLIEKEVTFAYRGTYDVGVDCLYVYDFFRIFRLKVRLYNYRSIYVMPRRYSMAAQLNRSNSDTSTEIKQTVLGIDRNDVSDIRVYEPGDPMKNVHWKLSSKSEELMVKQYNMNSGKTVYMFCDLAAHFGPEENASFDEDINEYGVDGVVELALAIATKTLLEGNSCVPVWYDSRGNGGIQMYPCTTSDELENVLRMLATAPVCSEDYKVGELSKLVTESQSVTLVYVTDHLDGGLLGDVTVAASQIGGSGSAVEVYFYDPTAKINNDAVKQEKTNYYNRCKRVFASHNIRVTTTTAEKCSQGI